MNQSINKVILAGHIINRPRWHNVQDKKVLHFTVVTGERIKRNSEMALHEEHHQVQLSEQAFNADVVKKDNVVYIQGRIQTRQVIDSSNVKRYFTEIIAQSVDLLTTTVQQPVSL